MQTVLSEQIRLLQLTKRGPVKHVLVPTTRPDEGQCSQGSKRPRRWEFLLASPAWYAARQIPWQANLIKQTAETLHIELEEKEVVNEYAIFSGVNITKYPNSTHPPIDRTSQVYSELHYLKALSWPLIYDILPSRFLEASLFFFPLFFVLVFNCIYSLLLE